jgi:hypothetical protein
MSRKYFVSFLLHSTSIGFVGAGNMTMKYVKPTWEAIKGWEREALVTAQRSHPQVTSVTILSFQVVK